MKLSQTTNQKKKTIIISTEIVRVFENCREMASEQLRRESVTEKCQDNNTTSAKDRVTKMTTHYETLVEKAREEKQHAATHHHCESPVRVVDSDRKIVTEHEHQDKEADIGTSLEDMSDMCVTAKEAKSYTEENLIEMKDIVAAKGQSAAAYVSEKATAARDAVVQGGKVAAEYVGKVAVEVKEQAVVAGWVATNYTGEKAVAAGETVAGAGKVVGEKMSAAKDAVVASQENVARKKEEAVKEFEAKGSAFDDKGDRDETISGTM
ncbi:hypothetical protein ACP275_13G039000 [Erythranthe tilingii]